MANAKGKLKQESLIDGLAVFTLTAAVLSGIKLLVTVLSRDELSGVINIEENQTAVTVVGGIAVLWISIGELSDKFKDLYK